MRTMNDVTITAPEGLPFIDIEREFDYPVELVFRAHKEPDLFKRWLGPRGYELDLEQFDFTTGGRYRYVHTVGGESYAFNGVFHVVRDNEFAIQTFEFEGYPDVVSVESIRFEPLEGGRSRLHVHAVYPTLEARDGMVASGQAKGVTEGYEQLDEVLASV
ncbi:MAG: SRPBCC family protein [Actinobacteria bacterium]|nr:SRPBCC family protein [Actinomycetota bacterium]